jgi:TolA-binding protein
MNCREVAEQDILERYLLGRLTDTELEEFEQHYFECDACSSQLETELTVQEELRSQPQVRTQAGGTSIRRWRLWTPAFAALALLLAVGIWWHTRRELSTKQASSSTKTTKPALSEQTQQPSAPGASLEELARVQPPPYSAVLLRGTEGEAQENFDKAMQHYLRGDYDGAIPGLHSAVKASPRTARFSFYLGASYLLTGQTDSAIASLRNTISLQDPTYSAQAHYYLAKAYLQKKDLSSARKELEMTIGLGGAMAVDAREILRQLSK